MRFNTTVNFHRINIKIKIKRINFNINKFNDFKNFKKKTKKSNLTVKNIIKKIITIKRYESYFINFN